MKQTMFLAGNGLLVGADAAPYFRIFNPILQGEKFDKEGEYVKKWVPELKNVPKKFIHRPWELKDEKIKNRKRLPYRYS